MTRSLAVLRLADGGTVVLVDVPAVAAGLGVPVPPALESLLATLPAQERAICARWAPKRQATFAAGRHALRLALVEAGVVDPTKVTRSALENAASVASILLTTEAAITDIKEDKADMPAMPPGGMGGMGGMY